MRHNRQRKPSHTLDGDHFLSGVGSSLSHPAKGPEQNMLRRGEMYGTLGDRWAREWVEERGREMLKKRPG